MAELTPTEIYTQFGEEVATAIEKAAATGYQLKQASEISGGMMAKFERNYFVNGKPPFGKFNAMIGYINAAAVAGFFVDGNAPKPKDADAMSAANCTILFNAIDMAMIRSGQIDPNS